MSGHDREWQQLERVWKMACAEAGEAGEAGPAPSSIGRFRQTIRRRNALEYAAAALAGLWFAAMAGGWIAGAADPLADGLLRVGAGMAIVGLAAMGWQLHRRASAPRLDPALEGLSYYRACLERQRAALRAVNRWYLGPLVPGLLVMLGGAFLDPARPSVIVLSAALAVAGVFLVVAWLNRRAADRLSADIADIDAMASDE